MKGNKVEREYFPCQMNDPTVARVLQNVVLI